MAEALIQFETLSSGQIDDIMAGREVRSPEDDSNVSAPPSGAATGGSPKGTGGSRSAVGGPVGEM